MKILSKKIMIPATVMLMLALATVLFFAHRTFYSIPQKRLALDQTYPKMPEDEFRHYIDLPLDYNDPGKGQFRGFYLFSPNFYKNRNITFLLTDGQMELVGPQTDFEFFENVLPGGSYVLIGVRGHSPTVFPEVFRNGEVDYEAAVGLYGSDQQVEDIERVRLDMIERGFLGAGEKINVFGASGAGILAQQYVSKYHERVARMILESTGAPDLARKSETRYSPDFREFNAPAAGLLEDLVNRNEIDKKSACNILYQIGRTEKNPRTAQLELLESVRDGGHLWSYKFKPIMNLSVLSYIIKAPDGLAARVRWFELVGFDLMRYDSQSETNLLYEISSETVSDLVDYYRKHEKSPKEFVIDRAGFNGEVLILKGTEDVVFSDSINETLKREYSNSRLLFFADGHRMQNNQELYRKIRMTFLEKGLGSEEFAALLRGVDEQSSREKAVSPAS